MAAQTAFKNQFRQYGKVPEIDERLVKGEDSDNVTLMGTKPDDENQNSENSINELDKYCMSKNQTTNKSDAALDGKQGPISPKSGREVLPIQLVALKEEFDSQEEQTVE